MTGRMLLASMASAVTVGAGVALLVRPTKRLAPRLRPYVSVSRAALGRPPELHLSYEESMGGTPVAEIIVPMLQSLAGLLGRVIDSSPEEVLLLKLRQAAMLEHLPESQRVAAYRVRQLVLTVSGTAGGFLLGSALGVATSRTILFAALGFVIGVTRLRGRLDKTIDERRRRMRIEIYTINQLLAVNVRVGGGVVHAVQNVANRGRGAVVSELKRALLNHRNGMPAAQVFERLARDTAEPFCARTYRLLASAEERGSDLADSLLLLAEDVREARREAIRRGATKRRAAMLVPTIAILAPVMLLFVAAPLPSIIFGGF